MVEQAVLGEYSFEGWLRSYLGGTVGAAAS